ncbi:MAG TPA: DUF1080 domain-containing protein [Verrucomicrobiae bacterium]|nr:DUF1080 domain-containing protein [Verrucomicrobiae bacterium]
MKTKFMLLPIVACAALSARADITPPPGTVELFNGKDLSGWYGWSTRDPAELWAMTPEERAEYKRKSIEGGLPEGKHGPENIKAHWRVENREIVNDGRGLYLTTDKDYRDFDLWVEYKALPDGDSGVYLRGFPQVQIWDSTKGDPRGLGQDKGSGGLWNNSPGAPGKDPSKKMDKPFGEWNQFKIRMIGERVTVNFNGENVVDNAVMENYFATKALKAAAQAAQKAGQPPPPTPELKDPVYAKGPIQLQTHGSEIRWRNIFLREIPSDEANRILSAGEKGFTRLDNGKDLTGWQGNAENYEVVDGAIVCKQGKGGNLLSNEEYGDMCLRFEFKLPLAGNNGIALRAPLKGNPASEGLEIQVLDTEGYLATKGKLKEYQVHGSVYHCVGAKTGFLRPTGEWNFEEIEVRGQNIRVTLNGTTILNTDLSKLDRSKLDPKHTPKGLDKTSGYIGFAGHNDPVAFRNIRVKRL